MAYHKTAKQKCGVKSWENSHTACEAMVLSIFSQLLTKRCTRHYLAPVNFRILCVSDLKYYFSVESEFISMLTDTFEVIIGVENVLEANVMISFFLNKFCPTHRTQKLF